MFDDDVYYYVLLETKARRGDREYGRLYERAEGLQGRSSRGTHGRVVYYLNIREEVNSRPYNGNLYQVRPERKMLALTAELIMTRLPPFIISFPPFLFFLSTPSECALLRGFRLESLILMN